MFKPITGYALQVASFGAGTNNRIIVFKSNQENGRWHKVAHANMLLVGDDVKKELRRFINDHSKAATASVIPGGISSRTLTELRKSLGVSKRRGRPKTPNST